jgi:Haem utilisation ChuX/HutX
VRNPQQEHCTVVDGKLFTDVMQDVTGWGDILFIVHTSDIVLECAGPLPPGTNDRGYYNVHGDSFIGGHIRADNCQAIAFASRPFMGRPRVPFSSSTRPARRCSRSSSAATRRACSFRPRSLNSTRCVSVAADWSEATTERNAVAEERHRR